MMTEKTYTMCDELRLMLLANGWTYAKIYDMDWGRRVDGDMHGVTLEREGKIRYYPGPFFSFKAGGQVAIVRRG